MAGLFDGLLPAVFSRADTIKKNVKGAIRDPLGLLSSIGQDFQTQSDQNKRDFNTLVQPGVFTTEQEKQAAMDRWTEEASNLTGAGLIKLAPKEAGALFERFRKEGMPEQEIWKNKKVGKTPSGHYFTENTFEVTAVDTTRIPVSILDAVPLDKVAKYSTDDAEMERILKSIRVYEERRPNKGGSLRAVRFGDGTNGFAMGINPQAGDLAGKIKHELGHAVRKGAFPGSISDTNLVSLHKRLSGFINDAESIKAARQMGGQDLELWKQHARQEATRGNDEVMWMLNAPVNELDARIASASKTLSEMNKYKGSDGAYAPTRHYLNMQDEQLSRLDEWRSGMSDKEQRDWFPKNQTLMEPLTDEYTDVLDWEKSFREWL